MSDLISREFLLTAFHNFFNGLNHTPTEEDIQRYIEVAPSADIMECARAIKEYCENTDCKECFIKKRCGGCGWEGLRPFKWNLPEGEKGGAE